MNSTVSFVGTAGGGGILSRDIDTEVIKGWN